MGPASVIAGKMDWKMLAVGVVGLAALVWYLDKRTRDIANAAGDAAVTTVKAVGGAVNITSRENIAARAMNALVDSTAGTATVREESLGEWLYSKVNPEEYKKLAPSLK